MENVQTAIPETSDKYGVLVYMAIVSQHLSRHVSLFDARHIDIDRSPLHLVGLCRFLKGNFQTVDRQNRNGLEKCQNPNAFALFRDSQPAIVERSRFYHSLLPNNKALRIFALMGTGWRKAAQMVELFSGRSLANLASRLELDHKQTVER